MFFNIAIPVLILLSGIIGLKRGFVRETMSLLIWGGVFVALLVIGDLSRLTDYVPDNVSEEIAVAEVDKLNPVIQVGLTLVFVFFVSTILGYLLQYVVLLTRLSEVDKVLGCVFGLVRGVLAAMVFVIFLPEFITGIEKIDWWQDSLVIARLQDMENGFLEYFDSLAVIIKDVVAYIL